MLFCVAAEQTMIEGEKDGEHMFGKARAGSLPFERPWKEEQRDGEKEGSFIFHGRASKKACFRALSDIEESEHGHII